MASVEAGLANAWLSQIGSKYVTVIGAPSCVASGLPFSLKLGGAGLSKRPLDSIPPPPPEDVSANASAAAVARDDHETGGENTPVTIDFEARRVFFCDKFEGAMKWSCPPPSATAPCEEPPPSPLRFELRPLPPVGNDCHLHCLCVHGGIPNAKVDRNWVLVPSFSAAFCLTFRDA